MLEDEVRTLIGLVERGASKELQRQILRVRRFLPRPLQTIPEALTETPRERGMVESAAN